MATQRAAGLKVIRWDGRPITKPGLYSGVPMERYHSADICDGPSISGSGLKTIFNESPAHFWDASYYNPKAAPRTETEALTLGQATHHLLLGEPGFKKLFTIRPDELPHYQTGELRKWHGNHIECRTWVTETQHKGLRILTAEQIENIKGMAGTLGQHPLVRDGILKGLIEHSMFWRDKESGVWLKCRPDAIPTASGDFANLKTSRSVLWIDLQRAIGDHGYHLGAALEREGCRQALGFPMSSYALVFVESSRPYCVRIVQLKTDDVELGWQQCRKSIRAFTHGMKTGQWPGPGGTTDDAAYIDLWDRYREAAKYKIEHMETEGDQQ